MGEFFAAKPGERGLLSISGPRRPRILKLKVPSYLMSHGIFSWLIFLQFMWFSRHFTKGAADMLPFEG